MLRLIALLLLIPVAQAQSPVAPTDAASSAGAEEGYLLAERLHAQPDPFSDEVSTVGRDERVRVVPVVESSGWFAVYREDQDTPTGFAFRPYVSRLGSSDLAALRQPDGDAIPKPTTGSASGASDESRGRLPSVTFTDGLTRADGVLTQVKRWANVRTGPGISNDAFGVIRPNTPFRVVSIDRGWGKIKLQGEREYGYVSGSLLHRVDEPTVVEAELERPPLLLSGEAAGGSATLGGATVGAEEMPEAAVEDVPGLEETSGIVYVTRTGHKYHRASCKHLRSVKFAMPLSEAMLNFAPCRTCTPPTRLSEDLIDEPEPD